MAHPRGYFSELYPEMEHQKYVYQLYPDAPEHDAEMLYSDREENCWHCGLPTHFIEVDFEARLCSRLCVSAKWIEYTQAIYRPDPPEEFW